MREGVPGLCCAIALFIGTCAGLSLSPGDDAWVDAALMAAIALSMAAWLTRHRTTPSWWMVLLAVALLGVVTAGIGATGRPLEALQGLVDPEPTLVRFEARLLERFRPPDAARTDTLDAFQPDAESPPWNATAELVALHGEEGRRPVTGRVTISAPTGPHDLKPGDRVEGVGWLAGPSAPMNPGEGDMRRATWNAGWVGRLRVDSVPACREPAGPLDLLLDGVRRFADQSLVEALEGWCDGPTRALVVAMTTGRRLPGYAALRQTFAATGLSHFLAISGFNIAILFMTCGAVMEALRVPGAARGWMLAGLAVIFLAVVDVEVSVLRAGVAGLLAGVSIALGRGWRSNGLLATAAMLTLVTDPHAAWNAGFQLSYLAVLALRYGSTPVEACLRAPFRGVRWRVAPVWMKALHTCCVALSASLAAWIASTPVTLAWFGSINPWCAVASTLLGPVAAALTVVATATVVFGQLPGLGWVAGGLLSALAWVFRAGVSWVGAWPACSVTVDPLPWWWAVSTLIATFLWWLRPTPVLGRLAMLLVLASAVAAAAASAAPRSVTPALPAVFEWVSISIGDGSVHLLRAGDSSVLFDAGTISRPSAGSGTIVPALRALGVRSVDTVIVSHPHLDHFSALPEVVDALGVRRVLLTEPWFRDHGPGGATAALMHALTSRGIEPERLVEGVVLRQGPVHWRCVHPPPGFRPTAVNDGSAAFVLHHDRVIDRPLALLLGDAQDESIARMLARRDILRPWVMELPHHGGWRPIAQALCEWARPSFVVQSTGARRLRRDRFQPCLQGAVRGATCRDGALRFSLDPENPPPRLEHWSAQGWTPLHPE